MIPIEMYCIMLNYTLRVPRQRGGEGGPHAACPKYISKFGVIEPGVVRRQIVPCRQDGIRRQHNFYPDLTASIQKLGPVPKSPYNIFKKYM